MHEVPSNEKCSTSYSVNSKAMNVNGAESQSIRTPPAAAQRHGAAGEAWLIWRRFINDFDAKLGFAASNNAIPSRVLDAADMRKTCMGARRMILGGTVQRIAGRVHCRAKQPLTELVQGRQRRWPPRPLHAAPCMQYGWTGKRINGLWGHRLDVESHVDTPCRESRGKLPILLWSFAIPFFSSPSLSASSSSF